MWDLPGLQNGQIGSSIYLKIQLWKYLVLCSPRSNDHYLPSQKEKKATNFYKFPSLLTFMKI